MTTRLRLLYVPAFALLCAVAVQGCSAHGNPDTAAAQQRFGVSMAQKGLWSEAFFRFQQAQRLGGGNDPQVLNNLAVASEALGKFDAALGFYKQALQLAPGDAALKNNYDRFLSFYESFRARGDEKAPKAPRVPAADNGTPGPAQRPAGAAPPVLPPEMGGSPSPPPSGPPTGGPGGEPVVPQPVPTPPPNF